MVALNAGDVRAARRPEQVTLIPLAGVALRSRGCMALRMACFIARRKAMRRSSWEATSSATSCALVVVP